MFLIICIGIFILCTIGKAIAEDWEKGQRNKQWCSSQIADAIYSGADTISSSMERSVSYLTEEDKKCIEKYKSREVERYTDEHGRAMRTRIIYNERGIPIAEERIVIQE